MPIERKIISTPNAPSAPKSKFPLSQAIVAGQTIYISGQVGIDPAKMELVPGGVESECRQVLKNLGEILKAAGADFQNVVKTTVLLADIGDFATVNKIYGETFKPPYPARAAYQVAALPLNCRVEIEAVALLGEIQDS